MIIAEFIISTLIFVSYLVASIMLLNAAKKSPIIEMKLLTAASFISLLFFVGMVLTALLNTPYSLNPLTETIFRSGFVFAQLCIFTISFAFLLPDFHYKYSSIAVIALITAANTASAMVNVTTFTLHVTDYIKLNFDPLGFLLFSISTILIVYSALQRLINVSKIAKAKGVAVVPTRSALIMSMIMSSFLVLVLLDTVLPLPIPGYSYFIPLLMGGLYLISIEI